jgi:DNA ligase-1
MTVIDLAAERKKRAEALTEWPVLYGKSSTGKVKVWRIKVQKKGAGSAEIIVNHGYQESEELQEAVVKVTVGKNIGRSNETNAYEQACSQAASKWEKKKDKKYATSLKLLRESKLVLPMLAVDYHERFNSVDYPALGQPKMNGVRCLAHKASESVVEYTSREGKTFLTLEHLTPPLLEKMVTGERLDGELFTREIPFEDIVSAVKRLQENTLLLQFWVYDIVSNATFSDRTKHVRRAGLKAPLITVPSIPIKDEEEMLSLHKQFVKNGFEGIIIRNKKGTYLQGPGRSKNLQKYKDMKDDEYKIIGAHDGVGKFEGAVTWICETADGEEFDCCPKGSMEKRYKWWRDREKYFGKMITVQYQNLTDDRQVPLFPVGLAIRDYE